MTAESGYKPPRASDRLRELRVAREPFRLLFDSPTLFAGNADQPQVVMAIPGLGSTDFSVVLLRRYLDRLGHRTVSWELGTNGRDPTKTLSRFLPRLETVVRDSGRPIALVGWSLGGVVSREAARDRPDLVTQVITYGTPLRGPRYTVAASIYTDEELDEVDRYIAEREQRPIDVPITSIFSKKDGVVDWRTCIDSVSPRAENVEVTSSHLGMGIDPDVWRIVADRLDTAVD